MAQYRNAHRDEALLAEHRDHVPYDQKDQVDDEDLSPSIRPGRPRDPGRFVRPAEWDEDRYNDEGCTPSGWAKSPTC